MSSLKKRWTNVYESRIKELAIEYGIALEEAERIMNMILEKDKNYINDSIVGEN